MTEIFRTQFSGKEFSIRTGYLAGQADGSVLVQCGETIVLVTAVSSKQRREGIDFLPLTVDYQEMTFAAGKIPGGFFKREGRPNEREILVSRLIDRSIRPLFPKGYSNETQVVATVLSVDNENDPDVTAMLGASFALQISDIPFKGPIAGVRVGRIGGQIVCNRSAKEMEQSDLDLFFVGRKIPVDGGGYEVNLVMLEGGASEVDEDVVLEAIRTGLEAVRPALDVQDEAVQKIGKAKRSYATIQYDEEFRKKVAELALPGLRHGYSLAGKAERHLYIDEVKENVMKALASETEEVNELAVDGILEELTRSVLREKIFNENRRIDGRKPDQIRTISCETGILPRTHGSGLFTRGETQALAVLTLGTSSDEQRMDYISGEEMRWFLLHYNFPPFSVGEVRGLRGPGRREIGHGALARRALLPVLPSQEDFPYTIRIVSEILSSNGSSSMATVCGGTLALMDGGVPVRDIVAGIAMGLLKEGDKVAVLSDILGDEDHAGDMDFKICGTVKGVTAMQMDIKIDRVSENVLRQALVQAKEGRIFIIGKIREAIAAPRPDISVYAPRITTLKVKPDKIRDVIGTGGKNIRQIISETGVTIDVQDDGTVTIASNDMEAAARAVAMVKWLTEEAEVGKLYMGTVKRVVDFGAFVEILPGTEGLVHISQLAKERVNKVTDILNEGEKVLVKVLEIDKQGKIRLSRKEALGHNVPQNGPR
ncbi:MAG TPA: polyribonucleotide nucleotidyltransferase [Syntrophales bacterium]|nr:polyribonucleotide nucleotidyltransferase [Syntrophales bacterium]